MSQTCFLTPRPRPLSPNINNIKYPHIYSKCNQGWSKTQILGFFSDLFPNKKISSSRLVFFTNCRLLRGQNMKNCHTSSDFHISTFPKCSRKLDTKTGKKSQDFQWVGKNFGQNIDIDHCLTSNNKGGFIAYGGVKRFFNPPIKSVKL